MTKMQFFKVFRRFCSYLKEQIFEAQGAVSCVVHIEQPPLTYYSWFDQTHMVNLTKATHLKSLLRENPQFL